MYMCRFAKLLLITTLFLLISNFTVLMNNEFIMKKSVQAAIVNDKFQQVIFDDGEVISTPICSHVYTWTITKVATCTSNGSKVYKCSKCGDISKTQAIYSSGHNYATTYESGSVDKHAKMLECTRCGAKTETIENHTFDANEKCTKCGYIKVCSHSYTSATCTSAKTCVKCGVTIGEKLGHNFSVATCQTPKKCTRCGTTEGTTVEHNYIGASCTSGGSCIRCGVKSEKGLGHAYTKATCTNPSRCVRCGDVSAPAIPHKYSNATCTAPAKCTSCNATKGKELGHLFTKATCSLPSTCTRCGKEAEKALGHTYSVATCIAPATCTNCGVTRGEKLEHEYKGGTCTTAGKCINCGKMEEKLSEHNYSKATCTEPVKCTICGFVKEKATGHDLKPATCTQPQTCKKCKMTVGKANGHEIVDATCSTPQKCKNCSLVLNKALEHTYTEATCKTPKTCVMCGKISGKPLKHDYIKATCTAPKTCKNCGATIGKPLEHELEAEQKDEKEHILSCKNCTYTKTEAHIYGKKCECGFSKEIVCEHPSYEWVTVEEAECNKTGLKVERCTVCEEVRSTKNIKVEHKYKATQIKGDAEYHVGVCEICNKDGGKGKHIFGVFDKCLICKYERVPLRCQDGKILLYHGAKIVRYEKLDDENHISIYECKKCKDEFKVEVQHSLKLKEVKGYNDETHTLVMECKTCKETFDVENKHIYLYGKCAVCGDKEVKETVCREEEIIEGHNYIPIKYVVTNDQMNHIVTYRCILCGSDSDFKKTEKHELKGFECELCKQELTEGVLRIYLSGFGNDTMKENGGTVVDTSGKADKKPKYTKAKYIEVSAFSAGANNLTSYISEYKNVAKESYPNPVYMRIILTEPAIANNKSNTKEGINEAVNSFVSDLNKQIPLEYREYISIVLVVGEKGTNGRAAEKTYNATLALYEALEKESMGSVDLYGVNAKQEIDKEGNVKYYVLDCDGNKQYCENIDYNDSRKNNEFYHADAQRAANQEFEQGNLKYKN